MQVTLDLVVIIQIITAIVVVAGFVWRLPSKSDIRRLDDRIDGVDAKIDNRFGTLDAKIDGTRIELKTDIEGLDAKIDDRYDKLDSKIDDSRKEMKTDMHRLEDRLVSANQYHAKSVDLLDAIRKELEERREAL
jgi:hypothetical protein